MFIEHGMIKIIFLIKAFILGLKSCSTKWISSDKVKKLNYWFWIVKPIFSLLSPLRFIIYLEAVYSKIIINFFFNTANFSKKSCS